MLTEERQAEIMRIVNVHGAVSVQELVNYLDISESTVRRDLAALDEEGLLRRVHGGATSLKEGAYDAAMEDLQDKYSLHIGEKRRIAQFAASLVRPDDFVYLDGGSTVEQMADFLVGSEASFVTSGLPTAQKLARSGVKVYVLPGLVKGKTESVIGSEMRDMLSRYHFTKGFFGTNGLTPQEGCTTPDVEEAACKGAAVRQCRQAYVLADVSKFGQSAHITFADLAQVTVVTAKGEEDIDYSSYESLTEVHIL